MKKLLLFLAIICISLQTFSQTKKIAHRSHSGRDKDLNYDGEDNFGLPPDYLRKQMVARAKSDSAEKARAKADSIKKSRPHIPIVKNSKHVEAVLPKKQKTGNAVVKS